MQRFASMKEGFSIIAVFAGLCAVSGLVGGGAIVARNSAPPVSAAASSTPPIAPDIKPATDVRRQMETWWEATQRLPRRVSHPTQPRKLGDHPMSASQQTWAPAVSPPETPRYLRDASRWPLRGPADTK